MKPILPALLIAALCACGQEPAPPEAAVTNEAPVPAPPPNQDVREGMRWESLATGVGYGLRLTRDNAGEVLMTLSCVDPGRLVALVPGFQPIGSEDRFALGVGDEPVVLVADLANQPLNGGVKAQGPIPPNLQALLGGAGSVSALYGTQQVGPHAPPTPQLAAEFAAACARTAGG